MSGVVSGYITAIILGIVGVVWIALRIVRSYKAESELLKSIRKHDTVDVLRQLAPEITGVQPSLASIEKARDVIRDESKSLKRALRDQILEDINQPSARGQKAFIRKIVTKLAKVS